MVEHVAYLENPFTVECKIYLNRLRFGGVVIKRKLLCLWIIHSVSVTDGELRLKIDRCLPYIFEW